MKVVLDTTLLIDLLNQEPISIQKLEELQKSFTLHTTAVNIYELQRGVQRLKRDKAKYLHGAQVLRNNLYVLPFNIEAAESTAVLYAKLADQGIFIDEADYMIAGCCFSNGISSIVTRNEKHFSKIPGLKVITY